MLIQIKQKSPKSVLLDFDSLDYIVPEKKKIASGALQESDEKKRFDQNMEKNNYQSKKAHGREVKLMIEEASKIFRESINTILVKDVQGQNVYFDFCIMMALYCCELSILGALYDGTVREFP